MFPQRKAYLGQTQNLGHDERKIVTHKNGGMSGGEGDREDYNSYVKEREGLREKRSANGEGYLNSRSVYSSFLAFFDEGFLSPPCKLTVFSARIEMLSDKSSPRNPSSPRRSVPCQRQLCRCKASSPSRTVPSRQHRAICRPRLRERRVSFTRTNACATRMKRTERRARVLFLDGVTLVVGKEHVGGQRSLGGVGVLLGLGFTLCSTGSGLLFGHVCSRGENQRLVPDQKQ